MSHNFLLNVLKYFNFGDKFIHWIKMMYFERKRYVINNGFLTPLISMSKGIFQGCPIPLIACFVKKLPETIIHFFCECEVVKPIWNDLDKIIRNKHDTQCNLSINKSFCVQLWLPNQQP